MNSSLQYKAIRSLLREAKSGMIFPMSKHLRCYTRIQRRESCRIYNAQVYDVKGQEPEPVDDILMLNIRELHTLEPLRQQPER